MYANWFFCKLPEFRSESCYRFAEFDTMGKFFALEWFVFLRDTRRRRTEGPSCVKSSCSLRCDSAPAVKSIHLWWGEKNQRSAWKGIKDQFIYFVNVIRLEVSSNIFSCVFTHHIQSCCLGKVHRIRMNIIEKNKSEKYTFRYLLLSTRNGSSWLMK